MISKVRIECDGNDQRPQPQRIEPQRDEPQLGEPQRDEPQRDEPQRAEPQRDEPQSHQVSVITSPPSLVQQSGSLQTQSSRLESDIQPCRTKTEHFLHDKIIPPEEVVEKLMKA